MSEVKEFIIKRIPKFMLKFLNRETILYLFFGVTTTIISFAAYQLFLYLNLAASLSSVLSAMVGFISAFFPNKYFVFQSKTNTISEFFNEMAAFFSGRIVTLVGEAILIAILVDYLGYDKTYCKLVTMVLVVIANYIISKKAVFTGN